MQNPALLVCPAPLRFLSAEDMRRSGIHLQPADVHAAVKEAWEDMRQGVTAGGKSVLAIPEEELWKRAEFASHRKDFADERLGWKLSCLYGTNRDYGAVKIIGANAFNRRLNLPRSTSTIVLLDKLTMLPLCIVDGTDISSMRTGTYASTAIELFFRKTQGISVFLFGAGPVAQRIIEALNYSSSHIVSQILIRSRSIESAAKLASRLSSTVSIPLRAVADNASLEDCAFVVTASNSRSPVFSDDQIKQDAVVLHLGGDESPEPYLARVIKRGKIFCDDIGAVSRRNSQSLALYFSRKGASLETVGPVLGITNLCDVRPDHQREPGQPVHINCVGLSILDLYVTKYLYEKFLRESKERPAA
jgi:ornithine cyclodeaminase/alanine dehydrogenase-like protein (mu-crystallin family)